MYDKRTCGKSTQASNVKKSFIYLLTITSLFHVVTNLDAADSDSVLAGKPIRELVAEAFPDGNVHIGGTTHHWRLQEKSGKIVAHEFAYLTPANAFKQTYIHPQPGVYNYQQPDDFIKYAQANGHVMRLHAPISPQCSPWAKTDSRTAEELTANLQAYLTALYGRYAGLKNVRWLDVVNETIVPETGDWMMPKRGTNSWENPWPKIGFDESHPLRPPLYIKLAFEKANKLAPHQKLIINQHGQLEPTGWETMKALVEYLRDNHLRVDGLGWQAHVTLGWEKREGNVERLGKLVRWCHENGLEFHITEFNVYLEKGDENKFAEQADTFTAITKTMLDNSHGGVVGINFWHMADHEPQKKRQGCLFDINHHPKPAYFKIRQLLESYLGE